MIGIIGAMQSEVEALFEQMTSKEKIDINNLTFYKGQLFGKDVVIVKCGIGKVNAALCTQLLILNFNVSKVINTGIAGATGPGLKIYDFVVSTEALYHDFDTTFFGYKPGQVPGMPEAFTADSALVDAAMSAFEQTDFHDLKIVKGRIASGDQFVSDAMAKERIVRQFGALCCEMEGAAIAQVCFVNKMPFCVLRAISDSADSSAHMDYPHFVALAASNTAKVIKCYMTQI